MNKQILFIAFSLITFCSLGQNKFTIEEVIDRARAQSPASKRTETTKETKYWQYRTFRAGYNPQLAISGNAPSYNQNFAQVIQPDGTRLFQPINQTNSFANLGLLQPIRWTGGMISANTNFNFFNDISRT